MVVSTYDLLAALLLPLGVGTVIEVVTFILSVVILPLTVRFSKVVVPVPLPLFVQYIVHQR